MNKKFSDMVEDNLIMVFDGIKEWEVENTRTGDVYEFKAVRRNESDSIASKTEQFKGYRNFPNGFWQVFQGDTHVGQAETFSQAKEMAKDYLIKTLRSQKNG